MTKGIKTKELTWLQEEVLRMSDEGMSIPEIAKIHSQTNHNVGRTLKAARLKTGRLPKPRRTPRTETAVEHKEPEKAAKALEAMSDPLVTIEEAALASGLSKFVVRGLMKRMKTRYLPAAVSIDKVTDSQLIDLLKAKRLMGLNYMDDFAFATAELRDLSNLVGIMTDKIQLLEGKPTSIIDDKARRETNEIMKNALEELQRRGVTLDAKKVEYSEVPDE